jgi:2-dehydro-3-deoxy-D-arabinonate dehydratase
MSNRAARIFFFTQPFANFPPVKWIAALENATIPCEHNNVKLYRTTSGAVVEDEGQYRIIESVDWDSLIARENLHEHLRTLIAASPATSHDPVGEGNSVLAPIGSQEVWAAGVTYYRSRDARMEESKSAGGGDFYDRVYSAERPELFFKATANRVVGHQGKVAIRGDATWSVPEPELVLLVSPGGKIMGYTVGNDMSSRDIEGENPLYLPQAKVYNRSCSLGPCILVSAEPLAVSTTIGMETLRAGKTEFAGSTTLSSLKRDPATLVQYLYRDNVFPSGCFLFTGTGIVPPDSFSLKHGDEIRIAIDGIGTLINFVG